MPVNVKCLVHETVILVFVSALLPISIFLVEFTFFLVLKTCYVSFAFHGISDHIFQIYFSLHKICNNNNNNNNKYHRNLIKLNSKEN